MSVRNLACALLLLFPAATSALAQAAADPVKNVMTLAEGLWSDDPKVEGQDYFDKDRLDALYSKRFAEAYRAAAKFPIYDDASGPFGYDVITNGQDGCPLKDVSITPGAEANGVTDVTVTFKLWTCVDDGSVDKDSVNEVHFSVITEDGKPVIDDIRRKDDEGKLDSLMTEMQDIVKSGQDVGPDAPQPDESQATPPAGDKPEIILSQPE
ncbi:hypothetical protein [Rhizobium sp. TRM95796]|uniref:hypothetical protein n=1 Tax=Rhizobium sp. TRM95796 TaxID=2979862 RepID=UPI0021E7348B|nr:hypothetical protein [Rhizobium sp. TRM95796]MCV3765305.1 hypothetical protein [Rhizobium sp. TRM95796]